MKPISVQLFSLREECKKDFVGVLRKLADIGYVAVEPAGFWGLKPTEFRRLVEDLGMRVSSSHGPWLNGLEGVGLAAEVCTILGLDMACSGFGPKDFENLEAIKRTADTINRLVAAIARHGLKLFLHNHWWEFQMVEGRLGYEYIQEWCPGAFFEIDTYWTANFGANDPAAVLPRFAARAPYLHIKDGTLVRDVPHVAVGSGKLDIARIIAAADPAVLRYLVVELDSCATDMFTAVEDSYRYLTSKGLAQGRR